MILDYKLGVFQGLETRCLLTAPPPCYKSGKEVTVKCCFNCGSLTMLHLCKLAVERDTKLHFYELIVTQTNAFMKQKHCLKRTITIEANDNDKTHACVENVSITLD